MSTDGLVVVDKPAGWTSHDVVAKLRGVFGQKRVGHAGTLDPDATGVLLVGLGRFTRCLRYLQEAGKSYRATISFGVATDTLDAAGAVLEREPMSIAPEDVERAMPCFVGAIEQIPPMVSAVKIGGRRLHELARRGEEVERPARPVRVERFTLESFEPGPYPEATVLVDCSSGTYVRVLAADLGVALGGCAHLKTLRRLSVGAFTLDEAHPLEEVQKRNTELVLSPAEAMRGLERVAVAGETVRAVSHGATFPAVGLVGANGGPGPFAVVDENDTLLAVYERRGAGVKPAVVLVTAENQR
ncbi:MAG: tRNA pseudouridine(55) synthase [Actinomycetia bacterium]|nr:tRNA pseudouridine(55) synthase [Actinomycetes bacterium]